MIVIGTGLEESIVAAAAARNGHSVLHVDVNDFYGSQWAAFTLDGLQKWAQDNENDASPTVKSTDASSSDANPPSSDGDVPSDANSFLKDGESIILVDKYSSSFKNVKQKWFVPEKQESETEKIETEKEEPDTLKKEEQSETPKEEEIEGKNASESEVAESLEMKEGEKPEAPKILKSTKPQIDQVSF